MNYPNNMNPQHQVNHLAWHETLEIHELVALQSNSLMELKKYLNRISDPELKNLHAETVQNLTHNLQELLQFYPMAPNPQDYDERNLDAGFYSGHLLALTKAMVRNYAIAITETATPALKQVLIRQLNTAIESHTKVFNYMHKHGYYPAYHLHQLLEHDKKMAHKALRM